MTRTDPVSRHRRPLLEVGLALTALVGLAVCGGAQQGASASAAPAPSHASATAATPSSGGPSTAACTPITEEEVAALFERWNDSLATGDAEEVADNYAEESILLPTVSNTPRLDREGKVDYFEHWLPHKPQGVVNERFVAIDCDTVVDAGVYTFTYADGTIVPARYTFTYAPEGDTWLITSHHSSVMPERDAPPVQPDGHASPSPTALR